MAKLLEGNFADLAATSTGGAAKNIGDLENVYVLFHGTFVGTWELHVSFDGGTTWGTFATGDEGDTLLVGPLPPCGRARIAFTRTSGTLKAGYGGSKRAA